MKLRLGAILILYFCLNFGFSQPLDYDLGVITKKTKINIVPKAISKKYKVKLAVGDTVKVFREENKKYFKISFNDKTGWVNKKRVKVLPKKKITTKPKVDILEHTKKLQSRFREEKLIKQNSIKKKEIENRTKYQKNTHNREKKNKVDKEKARKIVLNILYGIILVVCAFSIYLLLKKLVMAVISSLKSYKSNNIIGSIFQFIGYLLGRFFIKIKTKEKFRKRVLIVGGILFLYFFFLGGNTRGEEYFVNRIIDGDTFETSTGLKVRLIGVDTPESKHPLYGVQTYALEAGYALQYKILNRTVEIDITGTGRYGRALGYVYFNGESVNEYMIEEGYGRSYRKYPHKYSNKYDKLESEAKRKRKGMWQYY